MFHSFAEIRRASGLSEKLIEVRSAMPRASAV
jgi:hypothetical protein